MNFDDLHNEWTQQFDGKELGDQMLLRLFKESRQGKIHRILSKLVFHSVLFMIFNLLIIILSWLVLVDGISNWAIAAPAVAMILLSSVVFYKNVMQLDLIRKIDFSRPIIELQTTVEKLKLKRIQHNRFIFIFCFLYFWLAVTLFFRWDLTLLIPAVWDKAPIVIVIHLGMLLIWFPLSLWLLRIYDQVEKRNIFWNWLERNSYLTDYSTNFSLNESLRFIGELKSFGSEPGNA